MVLRYKCELVAYQFTILYRCGAPTNDYARATRPSNPTPDIIISRCALRHVICFVGLFVCGQMCYDHTLSVYIGDRPLTTIAGQALAWLFPVLFSEPSVSSAVSPRRVMLGLASYGLPERIGAQARAVAARGRLRPTVNREGR